MDFTWIIVSVTTGAMGVAPNEYIASMDSKSYRLGLVVHGIIIFKVMSHCFNLLHQFNILNEYSVPDFIAKK